MPVFPMDWLIQKNVLFNSKFTNNSTQQMLKDKLTILKNNEIINRNNIEAYLKKIKIPFQKFIINEKESYSKSECYYCTCYGYFSYIKCRICLRICCINHKESICKCDVPVLSLFYRDVSDVNK